MHDLKGASVIPDPAEPLPISLSELYERLLNSPMVLTGQVFSVGSSYRRPRRRFRLGFRFAKNETRTRFDTFFVTQKATLFRRAM